METLKTRLHPWQQCPGCNVSIWARKVGAYSDDQPALPCTG